MGPLLLLSEVSMPHTIRHTHTHTHTHIVRIFLTIDQTLNEAVTYTTHNKHKRRTTIPSA